MMTFLHNFQLRTGLPVTPLLATDFSLGTLTERGWQLS